MSKNITKYILLSLMVLCGLGLRAQNAEESDPIPVGKSEKTAIIDSICAGYYDWSAVSMTGKMGSSMLPLSPSVKIYMEKGKLIVMSISVPVMGEVGRLEIDQNEMVAINKMKGKYSSFSLEEVEPICPGGLEAIQNLFMGRITILGLGELKPEYADYLEIYSKSDSEWLLLPNQDLQNAEFVYYYTADVSDLLLKAFAVLSQNGSASGECTYQWSGEAKTLNFGAVLGKAGLDMTLRLGAPDTNVKKIDRLELTSKYKKVSPRELLKM